MSEGDIFREVEEDLRRERLKAVWDRIGIYVILTAVLIVVIVAGYNIYQSWSTDRAREAGSRYLALLNSAGDAGTTEAAATLSAFAADAPDGYALLARFRAATAYAQADAPDEAAALFEAIANDGATPELYAKLARVRLAQVRLAQGNTGAARAAVAAMAETTADPFNGPAQELLGLAAYVDGDREEARRWFNALSEGAGTERGIAQRADVMLALMDQTAPGTAAPEPDVAAGSGAADNGTLAEDDSAGGATDALDPFVVPSFPSALTGSDNAEPSPGAGVLPGLTPDSGALETPDAATPSSGVADTPPEPADPNGAESAADTDPAAQQGADADGAGAGQAGAEATTGTNSDPAGLADATTETDAADDEAAGASAAPALAPKSEPTADRAAVQPNGSGEPGADARSATTKPLNDDDGTLDRAPRATQRETN